MADGSAIEWTDATWNPVRGCTRISAGCGGPNRQGGCYAEKIAARFSGPGQPFDGFAERTTQGGRWTGKMALVDDMLTLPLRWKKPRRIFVNSMSDLFHENLPDEAIDKVFTVMALAPQHTFQVLTKRAARMREWFGSSPVTRISKVNGGHVFQWPLRNVWLGVSTEDQATADERIPHLYHTPAAKRFISAEPLLGPIDLMEVIPNPIIWNPVHGIERSLDWVIAGGESGPRARPAHPDWLRTLRDQCASAVVPFFFKQWGEWGPVDPTRKADCHAIGNDGTHYRMSDLAWPDGARRGEAIRADFDKTHACTTYRVGKKAAGAELDGRLHREFPHG
jgi:protein gp37